MVKESLKKKSILERIKSLEYEILMARGYLETGDNGHWHGFRPWFRENVKAGKVLPPHKDWVKNVFLPSREKALIKAEKLLDRFE
ncbi:MAG: hypothetical protein ABW080_09605 [Candidatus Thiodiazotropha sp.]